MIRLFLRSFAARLRVGKSLFFLAILGVALGVASVLGTQILNRNALAAFRGSMRAISVDADFSILGKLPTLDENCYRDVLADPDVEVAWPIVRYPVAVTRGEGAASVGDEVRSAVDPLGMGGFFLEIVGTDVFASARSSLIGSTRRTSGVPGGTKKRARSPANGTQVERDGSAVDLSDALSDPGWIAVVPALADEEGWKLGDRIPVSLGSRRTELRIGAFLDLHRYAPLATRKIALMDIASAQHLFGERGRIHQIDVRLRPGAEVRTVMERLEKRLGPTVHALTLEDREDEAAGLLEAFRLNLNALSLISLFVGFFLIFGSTQTSLIRRRREFGILRSVGATPGQVFGLILAEALVEGTLGTALGIPLAYFVAERNVDTVGATLTNIYLLEEIERLVLPPSLIVFGWLVGALGGVAGALLPAWETSRRDPRALLSPISLQRETQRWAPRLAAIALGLLAVTGLWFLAWGRDVRFGGFVVGFVVLATIPLVTPQLLRGACERIPVAGWGLAYSLRSLALRLPATSFAVGGLAVAVSMMLGITLLIGSFRATLETWVGTSVRADIYVTSESWTRAAEASTLDDELVAALREHPRIRKIETLRQFPARTGDRTIRLAGIGMELSDDEYAMPLLAGDPRTIPRRLRESDAVVVSEPLARKTGLGIGDSLEIAGPEGPLRFEVVGVSYDYSSENGAALVSAATLKRHFGELPIQNVALGLDPGDDPDGVVEDLERRHADRPIVFRSNRQLRREIFAIFDQTFAVTRILQTLALLIAATGITLSLLVRARERAGELALYRALGAHRRQIFQEFVGEGLGIGAFGLALGAAGGVVLAMILVHVINPSYFGWTIRTAWPWPAMVQQLGTVLAAAVAASLYPALRATRTHVQELSREGA